MCPPPPPLAYQARIRGSRAVQGPHPFPKTTWALAAPLMPLLLIGHGKYLPQLFTYKQQRKIV